MYFLSCSLTLIIMKTFKILLFAVFIGLPLLVIYEPFKTKTHSDQEYWGNTSSKIRMYLVELQYYNKPPDTVVFWYSYVPDNEDILINEVIDDPYKDGNVPMVYNRSDRSSESIIYYGVKNVKALKIARE